MNEAAATETLLDLAISRKLNVYCEDQPPLGGKYFGWKYSYPVEVDGDFVLMRDADCGLAKDTKKISMADWERYASNGPYRLVGMWSFVRYDDDAADAIAYCHRHPDGAGRELAMLRKEVERARRDSAARAAMDEEASDGDE